MLDREGREKLERSIIGSMLFDERAVSIAAAKLQKSDFSSGGALFEAMCDLHGSGYPVTAVTLQNALGAKEDVIRAYYDRCVPEAVSYSQVGAYCEMLAEQERLEQLRLLGLRLSGAESLEEAGGIVDEVNASAMGRGSVKPVSALQMVVDFVSRKPEDRPEYISFGQKALDEAVMLERGDVLVVGGYSSSGKTLLSMQFALTMAEKYRVGYFSLETGAKKLSNRMMAHLLGESLKDIKRGEITDEMRAGAGNAGVRMANQPGHLDFIEAAGFSARDIQAYALSYKYEIVIVDYLQIVQGEGRDDYSKVTGISMALHTMAQKHKIAVIELAQLKRPEKTKGKPVPPSMWDFKESGQIENDADVAMVLYPEDPDDNRSNRVLKVAKQKDGEKAVFSLKFSGATQTMTILPPSAASQIAAVKKAEREAQRQAERDQVKLEELKEDDGDLPF